MRVLLSICAAVAAAGCANASSGGPGDGGVSDIDGVDECANTPSGADVNAVGCAEDQVTPTLAEPFPPFGLTWTPTGDHGRPGGLTWTYSGIQRADLFHVYWVLCDDPATGCGVSLDGAFDAPSEHWQYNAASSDLPGGRLVFLNTTHIVLADATNPTLAGRLTVTIVDALDAPIPFATLTTLGVTGRDGEYGAEILGTAYKIVSVAEIYDTNTATWVPYLDYYDAAPTADPGTGTAVSFGGSFYAE